ncbi:ArsC family reductase [Ciceribacter thiooxidans]|uniref:ArsC family reductase n=1 Tax=Ciceribacter thiooxidans TaxID=1969821 RepID=A0ABV7HY37_9HYPH|nr:ArsC family reductase [Ciceribacter thiooxidans]MDI6835628.1 ArsC family reductase [Rhizobiaceae bacterium]
MQVTVYGIKNCDTMKKARTWLAEHGVDYAFHDYKSSGIDRGRVERWCDTVGWETVLNRAGTTFRKLPDAAKDNLDRERAIALMLDQPSMIKRPVLENEGRVLVGFKPELYDQFFAA